MNYDISMNILYKINELKEEIKKTDDDHYKEYLKKEMEKHQRELQRIENDLLKLI